MNCPNVSFEYYPKSNEKAMASEVTWRGFPFPRWFSGRDKGFLAFFGFLSFYIVYRNYVGNQYNNRIYIVACKNEE